MAYRILRDYQLDNPFAAYPGSESVQHEWSPYVRQDEYYYNPDTSTGYWGPGKLMRQGYDQFGPLQLSNITVTAPTIENEYVNYLRHLNELPTDNVPTVPSVEPLDLQQYYFIQPQAQLYDADKLRQLENVAQLQQEVLTAMGSNGYLTPDDAKRNYIKILHEQGPDAADEFAKDYSNNAQIAPIRDIAAASTMAMSPSMQIVADVPQLVPATAAAVAALTPQQVDAKEILAGTEDIPRYTPEELLSLSDNELIEHTKQVEQLLPTDWSKYGWKIAGSIGSAALPWLPYGKWLSNIKGNWKTNLIKGGLTALGEGITWKDELGNLITGENSNDVYQEYLNNYLYMLREEQRRRFSNSQSSSTYTASPADTSITIPTNQQQSQEWYPQNTGQSVEGVDM